MSKFIIDTAQAQKFILEKLGDTSAGFTIEENKCSRLSSLTTALLNDEVVAYDDDQKYVNDMTQVDLSELHSFVIKHDWHVMLKSVNPLDKEIRLPFDECSFEFIVNGVVFIYWIWGELKKNYRWNAIIFMKGLNTWLALAVPHPDDYDISQFLWKQINAICVVLDAEVVKTEVIRAPYKLSKKRIKKGKTPLSDYHIINLAKRHQITNPLHGHSGTKHRWHFRRGHWRHYEDHKTWIKWYFAGDPALGIIEKHYTV